MGPGPQPLSPPAPGLFAESSYKEADPAESGGKLQGAGKQQHGTRLGVCLTHHDLLRTMGKDGLPSKPNIFLLLLFFLPGNTSPTTEPQYMVLLPFLIHTDSPEKVCVQLTHLNESVTLSTTLEYQGENRSLIDDVVSENDVFTCIPFSLPKSNSTSVAFLTVTVKGATLQFRSRKSVLVKNSESLVFVQTDKPIYKPGQTVLFRIISLDKDFYPLNEKFPFVYVQQNSRIELQTWWATDSL
uniref:Macroglobulin domain-containing protein n=1 Tax=Accipiter nisus TaxID=211598 RepID=A0A8B9MIG4_9AVES